MKRYWLGLLITCFWFIATVLVVEIFGQAFLMDDIQNETFTNSITKLMDAGRDVYELGFNDGMECLSLSVLKYKYGDYTEKPLISELINQCRIQWHIENGLKGRNEK